MKPSVPRSLVIGLLLALALAVPVELASACTCSRRTPGEKLRDADAAFVGELVSERRFTTHHGVRRILYRFTRVGKTVKGRLPGTVRVESSESGATCGFNARQGQRIGLTLYRTDRRFESNLCSLTTPAELREAARRSPPPRIDPGDDTVPRGGVTTVSGRGFRPNGRVLLFAGRRGRPLQEIAAADTNRRGRFITLVGVPESAPPGGYDLVARQGRFDPVAATSNSFRVTAERSSPRAASRPRWTAVRTGWTACRERPGRRV